MILQSPYLLRYNTADELNACVRVRETRSPFYSYYLPITLIRLPARSIP